MCEKTKPLDTKRLILQEMKEKDAPLIVQWRSIPEVYQYFLSPKPLTREEHVNWYFNSYIKDENRIDFVAVEKNTQKRIGLFNIKRDIGLIKCAEIGYLLDKDAQGKGYAQEGIKRLMVFARDGWKCREAIFTIHEKNIASQILAGRLGYTKKRRAGEFEVYHAELLGGGRTRFYVLGANMHQAAA